MSNKGTVHVDYGVGPDCHNPATYGEICVHCNVCGRWADRPRPTEADLIFWGIEPDPTDEQVAEMRRAEAAGQMKLPGDMEEVTR
jgi:hypothetical protein